MMQRERDRQTDERPIYKVEEGQFVLREVNVLRWLSFSV